jgi:amino acid adenylation domain-containing protein
MGEFQHELTNIPEKQLRIQAKCQHPFGNFEEFKKDDLKKSIPELFESQVRKHPQRLAIKTKSQELTYGELNKASNRIAHGILTHRDEGEEPIALLLEQGAMAIAAILGVLKTGKIYVPVDPLLPRRRIQYILNDSRASLIVTNKNNLPLAIEFAGDGLQILNIDEMPSGLSSNDVGLSILPHNLAYIIYTSGSTGQPKGIVENCRNLLHETMVFINDYHICSDDRLSLLFSFCFYVSVKSIFPALLSGAALFILDIKKEGVRDLVNWLIQNEITVSSAGLLLRECESDLTGPEQFPNLRLASMGGDTVYKRDVELYKKYLSPNTIMVVRYASTESETITRYFIDTKTQIRSNVVPVGYALPNKKIMILNEDGEEVGVNQTGEIAVKSRYLAPGYWHKPDLTRQKFVSDPKGKSERVYRTGDLGYIQSDGCLIHTGRKDFREKIRGYTVEIAEIEISLIEYAGVKKAAVVAREDHHGYKHLIAYVVPSGNPPPTVTKLRRALSDKLPDYMLPSAFVFLDALPMTPSGKVDRKALPPPSRIRRKPAEGLVPPRDALEQQLTKTWEKLLGVKPIGVSDNFFELGGQSLLAVRLITQIEKILGKNLPLATLFQAPTIEQLASILREQGWSAPRSSLKAIEIGGSGSKDMMRMKRKIADHIPRKSHAHLKQQYHKIKKHPGYLYLKRQYFKSKSSFTKRFLSYSPAQLEEKLREIGLTEADTVYMHNAFNAFNGFSGGPQQIIDCILNVIGDSGNLLMVSMAYTGSTEDYLKGVKTFDVIKAESSMGIITEIFRRKKNVVRSLNPAHPILAFGPDAKWITSDHDKTLYSCGKGSPFEKITKLNTKAFFFDVSFRTGTFFHYLEDKFKDCSPVQLYDDEPLENTVIDSNGNEIRVKTYVFSKEARENRSARLIERELKNKNLIKTDKIGNTKLTLVNLKDVIDCAQALVNSGIHFYNT